MQWGIKCKFIRIARDNALPEHIHHHGNLAWKVHGFLAGEPSMEREERIISLNRIIGIAVDVRAGKRTVSPEIENMLANDPPVPELSPRQRDILESITRGLTNNQIALQFEISPESVKTHIAKLFEKIGAASRSEAVSIALRKHLLKI